MEVLTLVSAPAIRKLWDAWGRELMEHCRASDDDARLLFSYLPAAYSRLDGRNGRLGRALLTQTWRLALPQFRREISIPLPPLGSVEEITYRGADDAQHVMAVDDWDVIPSEPAALRLRPRIRMPATALSFDAVTVTFVCGYGDAIALPAVVKTAIFRDVAMLFENREGAAYGSGSFQQAPGGDLLDDLQVWAF